MNWAEFSEALDKTPPGNEGAMMLPWFEPEITPNVQNSSEDYFGLEAASGAQHVRAIVEAQAMALARHSEWMGTAPRRIYATGGAAENRAILQVLAEPFIGDPLKGPFTVTTVKVPTVIWERLALFAQLTGEHKQEILAKALKEFLKPGRAK